MTAPDPYSFRELWRQCRACRRNKRRTRNALAFEVDAEAALLRLRDELRSHRYRPGRSVCFVTDGAKPREVFAAGFRDRIVHHLLVSRLEPIFEPRFIHDSFACRKGKGTLAASDRLTTFLRRATANGRRPAWALHLDVASFFTSIHKRTLYRMLRRAVRDPELRWLIRVLLFHDPTANYGFQARRPRRAPHAGLGRPRAAPGSPGYAVPARKSLFGQGNRRGLAIGNLTSQFWANVYLDPLDQFVKRTLGCRYYLRYVDDLCLLSNDPGELERWHTEIARFLRERLGLALRADGARPTSTRRGVDFVGWRTWWDRRLPRRRTRIALETRLGEFERSLLWPPHAARARSWQIDLLAAEGSGALAALRSTMASYAGHLRYGCTRRYWTSVWARRPWLDALLERRDYRVRERWRPARAALASRPARRCRELTGRAGSRVLVFWRVGRFVEFRGPQRLVAERVLALNTAMVPRGGYALVAGFPVWLAPIFRARALRRGASVVTRGGADAEDLRLWIPQRDAREGRPTLAARGSPVGVTRRVRADSLRPLRPGW